MSISNPRTGETNPAKKHIKFKSGVFAYYDKEKEENVEVPMPLEFIAIDELSAISGWHEKSKSGIYSNEVGSTQMDELVVKSFKGGELVRGLYSDIKDKCKAEGGRYEKSVYATMKNAEGEIELVRFGFVGSSLSAWIEKEVNFTRPKFTVSKTKDGEKGATKYKIPIFEISECTEEEWAEAVEVDKEVLQPYLKSKNVAKKEEKKARNIGLDEIEVKEEKEEAQGVIEKVNEGRVERGAEPIPPKEEEIKVDDLPF